MNKTTHMLFEAGPEKGRELSIPLTGARLGRSSENDIMVADGLLSRHHCRVEFRDNDGLWITDLDSANLTLVNDKAIDQQRLHVGDRVLIGDTLMRVVCDQVTATPAHSPATPATTTPAPATPLVDLGFSPDPSSDHAGPRGVHPVVWVAAIIVAILAIFYVAWTFWLKPSDPSQTIRPLQPKGPETLQIVYEKVEATNTNVFRYVVEITPDYRIACQIDDVANNRHVRKSDTLETNQVERMIAAIRDSGFYGLRENYDGIQPSGLSQWDLTIIIGNDAHRCLVRNQSEPAIFRELRAKLEDFTKTELGIWAIQFSEDRLKKMANDAFLEGCKLYAERDIEHGNLSGAISAYTESEWYLETVDPKPDFFRDIVGNVAVAKDELQKRYIERNFTAEKEMKLGHWPDAASELRMLLDMIPDPDDPRHKDANRKLLEAESRSGRN